MRKTQMSQSVSCNAIEYHALGFLASLSFHKPAQEEVTKSPLAVYSTDVFNLFFTDKSFISNNGQCFNPRPAQVPFTFFFYNFFNQSGKFRRRDKCHFVVVLHNPHSPAIQRLFKLCKRVFYFLFLNFQCFFKKTNLY